MPSYTLSFQLGLIGGLLCLSSPVCAYDSGSTGADGAFNPLVNTELTLPPSGVFNFSSVNIPSGVTVSFKRNATNTPVVMLVAGNVSVAGTIHLSGAAAPAVGAAGDGNIGDDGLPGVGGPGGYDGGTGGGTGTDKRGGAGLGPGAGGGGAKYTDSYDGRTGGGGGGFGAAGSISNAWIYSGNTGTGGPAYGTAGLLPLLGGSGGGGGAAGPAFQGGGGGGGGGGILIAANGTVAVTGSILANGGKGADVAGDGRGAGGGGGSGGGIRIVASRIEGNGTISAAGGTGGTGYNCCSPYIGDGAAGGAGRIRFEADTFTRTAASTPSHSFDKPGPAFVAGFPTLRIASVAGIDAPAQPTGNADIVLPANTANPVTVGFATSGVPVGNTVKLTLTPQTGLPTTVISPALAGTTQAATASVQVMLPNGPSTLSASTSYTITAAAGDALAPFAGGERVREISLEAGLGSGDRITLVTASGREFEVPRSALARRGD